MATKIFVNLPVKDLKRSTAFFTKLGFEFNPQPICDATKSTEVLVCLSRASRDAVNDLVGKALSAGGTSYAEPKDYGFMFQHGFQDPDGHIWELIYMDPKAVQQA